MNEKSLAKLPGVVIAVVEGVDVLVPVIEEMIDEAGNGPVTPTFAMAELGHVVVEKADIWGVDLVVEIFGRIEGILESGSEEDGNAAATGFLEAVASSLDQVPSARWILEHAGEKARGYLMEWDQFCGVRRD